MNIVRFLIRNGYREDGNIGSYTYWRKDIKREDLYYVSVYIYSNEVKYILYCDRLTSKILIRVEKSTTSNKEAFKLFNERVEKYHERERTS